ncbi:hypothetical protein EXIGLDRAFT_747336 [Exidia glandulosa HHB12029]|uniref:Uncharacterized protein n=1 Tax=Exidia glandulosa HHB12029 TaxID=1314781 RepID=A0A165KUV0_EXIGL|nr:hypothetical protein EXIGLDRAFT_747336 [Exidia glandulosa HHB12029]
MLNFTSALLALALVLGAATAAPASNATTGGLVKKSPFAINLGNTQNQNVAWVLGDDKCSRVVLSDMPDNPCGHEFSLHGQSGFVLQGCGGPQWITQNGNFWAGCTGKSEKDKCDVHTTATCAS